MARTRRRGPKDSETRMQLIDAAQEIIGQDGINALTTGRVAEKVGLARQIFHYYFESVDDLLSAIIRQNGDKLIEDLETQLNSGSPLSAVLDDKGMVTGSVASLEIIGFSLGRPLLRAEISRFTDAFIRVQAEAFQRHFDSSGIQPKVTPSSVVMMFSAVAQSIIMHTELQVTTDQSDFLALLNRLAKSYLETGKLSA